jgi:hypothetical protein
MTFINIVTSLLYVSYYAVAFFYFFSGLILLFNPKKIEHRIPGFFPLLVFRKRGRVENALNLIIIGLILYIVGYSIFESSFFGFFTALVLSAWEVYLSIFFYLKHHTFFDAMYHFILHILLVIFLGWMLITLYGKDISGLEKIMKIQNNSYFVNLVAGFKSIHSEEIRTHDYK